MKKRLVAFLVVLGAAFLCAGAYPGNDLMIVPDIALPFETFAVSGYNHASHIKIPEGRFHWGGGYYEKEENALLQKTVTAFGKAYTGQYVESLAPAWLSFVIDRYETEDGVFFGVAEGTDRVVELTFFRVRPDDQLQKPDLPDPKAYAISCASEYAATLADLQKYEMSVEADSMVASIEGVGSYNVRFQRIVNGVKSMEYFCFRFSSKGELVAYDAGESPGTFDCVTEKVFTLEAVNACVEHTMRKQGASYFSYCKDVKYKHQVLAYTPQGEYGVVSDMRVQWEHRKKMDIGGEGAYVMFSTFGKPPFSPASTG